MNGGPGRSGFFKRRIDLRGLGGGEDGSFQRRPLQGLVEVLQAIAVPVDVEGLDQSTNRNLPGLAADDDHSARRLQVLKFR